MTIRGLYILQTRHHRLKARFKLRKLSEGAAAAGWTVRIGDAMPGPARGETLLVWGSGHPDHQRAINRQRSAGGRFVVVDNGMVAPVTHMRVSLDEEHPRECVWRMPDHYDGVSFAIPVGGYVGESREVGATALIIGQGMKARAGWGPGDIQNQVAQSVHLFGLRNVQYRPKPKRPPEPEAIRAKIAIEWGRPLDDEIRAAGLVVCRSSTVAVRAAQLGCPVVASAGVGAGVFPHTVARRHDQPSFARRAEWLYRLGFWNWPIDTLDQPHLFRFLAWAMDKS